MNILAIDPGYEQSAVVTFDGMRVLHHETLPNDDLLRQLGACANSTLVVEQIAAMGMAVGAEVFETVYWSGRFAQAFKGQVFRVKRHEVKSHLCAHPRAKDANIRVALLDRFGPGKEKAVGTKKAPGPLYGIKADEWAALAVAVTWWDTQLQRAKTA